MKITIISAMDVNCYLVQTDHGFILIDSGFAFKRKEVDRQLTAAGLRPGSLKLIIHTHGDADHAGNSAWLKVKYGGQTALHPLEVESVRTGNLANARKNVTRGQKMILNVVSLFAGIPHRDRFQPDILLPDNYSLREFGMDAICLHLPGHSMGSCGLLTSDGSLFCGDLFTNWKSPEVNTNMDDAAAARESLRKLKNLEIGTIFPGHGRPFPSADLKDWITGTA